VEIRRRALDTRPFVFVEVDLREGEGAARVREKVRQHDLGDAVVLVDVTGEGDPVTPAAIEEFATDEGALIARVTDRREVETDAEIDVSFADPEDAVRERVEEMGLSEAAFDVEEAVRADTIPDTNVRETVKRRVEERIDDLDDLDAFDRGETVDGDAEAEDNEAELADDEAELADDETDGEPIGGKDDTATASAADIDEQVSMEDYL